MKSISERKQVESAKGLRAAQKELKRQEVESHVRDVHKIDRGDSFKPIKVVGGDEHKSSHDTVLQRKLKASDGAVTRGTDVPTRTLFQKQIKQNPATGKE
jgi:hypothetical protein